MNKLNHVLGAYGKTINVNNPINLFKSDDKAMMEFAKSVAAGKEKNTAVIFYNTNPAYSLPNGDKFAEKLSSLKLSVSMAQFADETASKCTYVCPDHHALEQWGDANPKMSHYAVAQPTIFCIRVTNRMG